MIRSTTPSSELAAVCVRRCATVALVLIVVATAATATARADARIVVGEGKRRIVALSPNGEPPQTLIEIKRGAILATAASRNGEVVAYVSRTLHRVDGRPVATTQIWTRRRRDRPRLIKTVVSRGYARNSRPIDSVALSPDGLKVLFETRDSSVYLVHSDGTRQHRVRTSRTFSEGSGRNSTGPEFTPDGRRIIAAFYPAASTPRARGGIGTVGLAGGRVHLIRRSRSFNGSGRLNAPTISLDGRHIAFQLERRFGDSLWVMDRNGAKPHKVVDLQGWLIDNPSFSPSGHALAFVGDRPNANSITVIGRSPSALFQVGLGSRRPRRLQSEGARLYLRSPNWVR